MATIKERMAQKNLNRVYRYYPENGEVILILKNKLFIFYTNMGFLTSNFGLLKNFNNNDLKLITKKLKNKEYIII